MVTKRSALASCTAQEIADELKAFIRCPMDPSLRKVLKLAVAAIEALIEPDTETPLPSISERIEKAE
jgi:hypothetical protein